MSDWRSREPDGLEERLERRERLAREQLARGERKEESTVADLVNDSVRKLVTAIVVAGALIGGGVYLSGDEVEAPKYQVTTTPDGRILRVNTESGTVIACEGERCGSVLERGQDLDDSPPARVAVPREDARPALPAPGASPAPAASPSPDNSAAAAPTRR
jgi:hypothetical protein